MEILKVKSLVDYRLKATNQSGQPSVNSPLLSVKPKPKLLDQVRQAIRTRHYSPRTEETYVGWIKRFIFYHNKRHPGECVFRSNRPPIPNRSGQGFRGLRPGSERSDAGVSLLA